MSSWQTEEGKYEITDASKKYKSLKMLMDMIRFCRSLTYHTECIKMYTFKLVLVVVIIV